MSFEEKLEQVKGSVKEGLEKLQKELDELRTKTRGEVAQRLKEAIAMGDLSENSEYDDAKNQQSFVEGRIKELEQQIRTAAIIDSGKKGRKSRVDVGMTVTIEALEDHADPGALPSALLVGQGVQLDVAVGTLDLAHAHELAIDPYPAGVDGLQLVDAAQQGGLARAGGAHEHRHRAGRDGEVDALEDVQLAEELVEAAYAHLGDGVGARGGESGRAVCAGRGGSGHEVASRKGLSSVVCESRIACCRADSARPRLEPEVDEEPSKPLP